MIGQSQPPIIRNLSPEPLIRLVPDLADQVVVERKLVIGGDDEVGGYVPDLLIRGGVGSSAKLDVE